MWSLGRFIAPAALLLLGAAVFLQLTGPREGVQKSILTDPPTNEELTSMVKTGIGSVVVGVLSIAIGAFGRGLFGSCARETMSCALARAHWGAVGLTVLGLLAIGYGGFLLWKQAYARRLMASNTGTS